MAEGCAQSTGPGDQLASGEPSRLGHSTGLYTIEESEAHIAHNILQPGVVGSQGYGTTDTETDTGNYRLNQPGMRSVCGQGSGTRPSAESVAETGTAFNLWSSSAQQATMMRPEADRLKLVMSPPEAAKCSSHMVGLAQPVQAASIGREH